MKNPFIKQNSNAVIAAVLLGTIAAGAISYLFLTDSGSAVRSSIKKKAKQKAKELASGAISKKTGLPKKAVKAVADHLV